MCLNPKKIRNPTKRFSMYGGQPLYITVPCGSCADCKKKKRLEWRFRSYHHINNIINSGGYVYFDTLTYDEDNVPHLSDFISLDSFVPNLIEQKNGISVDIQDFTCFCHSHWKNFLKNIRRQLDYHFKGCKFDYFLTSEYGTKEGCTHRPHYHILFFVHDSSKIHPLAFSRLVKKCWNYGITDGIDFKPLKYVAEHVYGYDLGFGMQTDYIKVCNYVAKYITKDSTFQKTVNNRLKLIKPRVDEDTFKSLKREIDMFHRQSKGFGASFLDCLDKDEYDKIFNKSYCTIKDANKVKLKLAVPQYYVRKLFYTHRKYVDGSSSWLPTQLGTEYLYNRMLNNINNICDDVYKLCNNMSTDNISFLSRLFGNRSVQDFAIYKVMFQNRSKGLFSSLLDKSLTCHDILLKLCHIHNSITDDSTKVDVIDHNNRKFVSIPYSTSLFHPIKHNYQNYENFLLTQCITEDSLPEFAHFDKIDMFITYLQSPDKENKQLTFDFIEDLQKKIKLYENL